MSRRDPLHNGFPYMVDFIIVVSYSIDLVKGWG